MHPRRPPCRREQTRGLPFHDEARLAGPLRQQLRWDASFAGGNPRLSRVTPVPHRHGGLADEGETVGTADAPELVDDMLHVRDVVKNPETEAEVEGCVVE